MSEEIDWSCADCGQDTRDEYYTVHDWIWEQYGAGDGDLCIGCLEERAGWELDASDFPHWLINVWNIGEKSERLIERLTRLI